MITDFVNYPSAKDLADFLLLFGKTFEAYDFLFLSALSQLIDNSDLNRFINLIKEIK